MKFRPPTHRVDAPIVFIHPADPAWDQESVGKAAEEHGKDSAFARYHAGATRYDAGEVQALLSGQPTEFHLRRLDARQLIEVQSLLERDVAQDKPLLRSAFLQAACYGLKEVKKGAVKALDLESPCALTSADIELLCSTELGIGLIQAVGQAVYLASQPLRDDEKKH